MINTTNWPLLNKPQPLEKNEVHIWRANLELPEEKINQLFNLLNKDEQERAQRFHFARDRARFIAARGMLRKLLGQYVAISPEQLQFNYNQYGKPNLIQKPEIQFNLSHAHNQALIAVTLASAVGVDIEYCDREVDIDGISKRFFSANECQVIQSLTDVKKRQVFFTAWVRKEAFLKALGMGLSYSLDKVEVSLLPEQPARIIALHDKEQKLEDWSLFNLTISEDYQAALVVKGNNQTIKTWQFHF